MKKVFAVIISVCLILSAGTLMASAAPSVTVGVTDGNAYKNLFAVSGTSAVEDASAEAVAKDQLAGYVDNNKTAYVAFAVYADKAGDYNFVLNFSGTDTAAVKVGTTVKTVSSGTEFALSLEKGVNLIICFGATAEDGDKAITYTGLVCEDSLYEIEGDFYIGADANADGRVNIIDLVRIKKHLASGTEISTLAADLTGEGTVDVNDVTAMRKCLLGVEGAKEKATVNYNLTFVNRDNDVSDNWDF